MEKWFLSKQNCVIGKNFNENKDKLEKEIFNKSNIIHPFPVQSISENPIVHKNQLKFITEVV